MSLKRFHHGSWLIPVITLLIILTCAGYTYRQYTIPASERLGTSPTNGVNITVGEILNKEISQTYTVDSDDLAGFSLKMATFNRINTSHLQVSLTDMQSGEKLETWNMKTDAMIDNAYQDFSLKTPLTSVTGKSYKISLTSKDAKVGNAVTVWASTNNTYPKGNLLIAGTQNNGDLGFKILGKPFYMLKTIYITVVVALLFFSALISYLTYTKKIKLEKLFLLCITFFGVIYMFLLPPMSSPDETRHYISSYKMSNTLLFKAAVNNDGDVVIRAEDAAAELGTIPDLSSYSYITEHLLSTNSSTLSSADGTPPVDMSPIVYIPQTLGIMVARLLNLGYVPLLFFGRLFNLMAYAALVYYAIKMIPFGKMILFSISLLPMTLELISSYSYDTLTMALSFFYVAYCVYLANVQTTITKKDIAILMATAVILAPFKLVYVLLAFTCLIIPREKFGSKKRYFQATGAICIAAVVSLVIFNLKNLTSAVVNVKGGVLWNGKPSLTVSDLLSNPPHALNLFFRTFKDKSDFYLTSMLGNKLGWLEIAVPLVIISGFAVILLLSSLRLETEKGLTKGQKLWSLAVIIGIIMLIILSMVGATPINYHTIEGVQGRYFLPILPLVLLLISNSRVVITQNIDKYMISGLILLQSLTILNVFQIISGR